MDKTTSKMPFARSVDMPQAFPNKNNKQRNACHQRTRHHKRVHHFSINSLAMFAKRQELVFASVSAWYRIVREFNLRRPGVRIYPPKPKIGIRALEPNQIWHVDVSVFRIMNGAKVYIQAIIDNASRYVLAWEVTQTSVALHSLAYNVRSRLACCG